MSFMNNAAQTLRGAAAGVLIAGGLSLATPAMAEEPAAIVDMTGDLTYEPREVTVSVGDTVEWRNTSSVVHTVTADPQKAADPDNVRLPQGAETFDSGTILPRKTYSYTFTVPGRYKYVCLPHEAAAMIGEVVVKP